MTYLTLVLRRAVFTVAGIVAAAVVVGVAAAWLTKWRYVHATVSSSDRVTMAEAAKQDAPSYHQALVAATSVIWLAQPQDATPRAQTNSGPSHTSVPSSSFSTAAVQRRNCEKEARNLFRREGWEGDPQVGFTAHYNARLKTCFQEIVWLGGDPRGRPIVSKTLGDVRGREYAVFQSVGGRDDELVGQHRLLCEFILPSGERFECHSSADFDAAVDDYMK